MKRGVGSFRLVVGFAGLVASLGCSSDKQPSSSAGQGDAGAAGGGGGGLAGGTAGEVGVAGNGGATFGGAALGGSGGGGSGGGGMPSDVQPFTSIRFLQAYLNGGAMQEYDIWARKNDRSWVSLVKDLGYGVLTDYIEVPIGAGLNTMIWFIPPGSDPEDYAISIGSFINFQIEDSDTGRHTLFMHHVEGEADFAAQLLTDGDPELTPPQGSAHVAFNTSAVRPIHPLLDYGDADTCIDRASQDNYQSVTVGSYTFSLYDGASAMDCQGSVIVSAPATMFGDREVWFLYAMGDAENGFELRPVQLSRE
jgi:hypothetical protein